MFQENKYTKWYFLIISNAKTRTNIEKSDTEQHHIIPKSLGGDNSKKNLIRLTHREHYICHLLLTKMLEGESKYKMSWALMLLTSKRKVQNSRQFEKARRILSQASKNRPKTTAWRKKMSDRMRGSNNPNYNHNKVRDTRSASQKKLEGVSKMKQTKISQASLGLLPIQQNPQIRESIRLKRIGKKQTDKQKSIASEANSLWYIVETPEGEHQHVFNLKKFCEEKGLDRSNLYCTFIGKTKQHKGYKLIRYLTDK